VASARSTFWARAIFISLTLLAPLAFLGWLFLNSASVPYDEFLMRTREMPSHRIVVPRGVSGISYPSPSISVERADLPRIVRWNPMHWGWDIFRPETAAFTPAGIYEDLLRKGRTFRCVGYMRKDSRVVYVAVWYFPDDKKIAEELVGEFHREFPGLAVRVRLQEAY